MSRQRRGGGGAGATANSVVTLRESKQAQILLVQHGYCKYFCECSAAAFACITETQTKSSRHRLVGWGGRGVRGTHRADCGKGVCRRWERRVVQAQQDDGGINKDASHCGDVAQLGAGKFNCSVERRQAHKKEENKRERESRERCDVKLRVQPVGTASWRAWMDGCTYLSLRKCKLKARNAMASAMPTLDSVAMV